MRTGFGGVRGPDHARPSPSELPYDIDFNALTKGAYQIRAEVEWLAELLARINPKRILEIGVAKGGVTRLFTQAVGASGHVVGVDISDELIADDVKQHPNVTLLIGDSHDPSMADRVRAVHDQYDLLLIDGDHNIAGVRKDTELYLPLVKDGGIVLWHDVRLEPSAGIKPYWYGELRRQLPGATEFFVDSYNCGLGCWVKTPRRMEDLLRDAIVAVDGHRAGDALALLKILADGDPYFPGLWAAWLDAATAAGQDGEAALGGARKAALSHAAAESADVALERARIAEELGLFELSLQEARRALELDRQNLTIRRRVLELMTATNQPESSLMDAIVEGAGTHDCEHYLATLGDWIERVGNRSVLLQQWARFVDFAIRVRRVSPSLLPPLINVLERFAGQPYFDNVRTAVSARAAELPEASAFGRRPDAPSPVTSETSARDAFKAGWDSMLSRQLERAALQFEVAAGHPAYREKSLMAFGSCQMHFHNADGEPDDLAMRTYRTLVAEYPGSFEHWRSLGDGWLDCPAYAVDQSDEPMRCFETALALQPSSSDAWYGFAMLLQHQRRFAEAVDAYSRVVDLDPEHGAARFRLWSLARQGHAPWSIVPPPLVAPATIDEFAGDDVFAALRRAHEPVPGKSDRAVILRGLIRGDIFDRVGESLDAFQEAHFRRSNDRPNFRDLPDRERQLLSDCIEEQLLPYFPAAWSYWANRGFTAHRHQNWYLQVQGRDHVERRTVLHQDHPVYSQESDWATLWIPLMPCGPGVAPTIRVLPLPMREGIDWEVPFRRVNRVNSALIAEYFDPLLVTVAAAPGDVVMFGRHVLHDTLVEASMPNTRMSIDVRYTLGPARLPPDFCDDIASILAD